MADTFVKIATVTVGSGGASSIDFTSIPSTYTDLQVLISLRWAGADTALQFYVSLNGSTSGFTSKYLEGNGTSAASSSEARRIGVTGGSSTTANTFSSTSLYFPNYAGSTYKSYSSDSVEENNGTQGVQNLIAGLWSNTAAINQITISYSSGVWAQYSTATLYGISNS